MDGRSQNGVVIPWPHTPDVRVGRTPTEDACLASRGCQVLLELARRGDEPRLRAAVAMLEGLAWIDSPRSRVL